MKLFVTTIAAAAMLAGAASAQTSQGGSQPEKPGMMSPKTTGAAPMAPAAGQAEPKASGAIGTTPNGAAGGKVPNAVNPDRVAPSSPGGQGSPGN
jgi:hypothetical protein